MRNKLLVAFVSAALSAFALRAFAVDQLPQEPKDADDAIEAPEDEPAAPTAPAPAPRQAAKAGEVKKEGASGNAAPPSAPPAATPPAAAPASPQNTASSPAGDESGPCEYNGALACEKCLVDWGNSGDARNNHFCKDKSRANKTKGWDCFNLVDDTSHGYECISYCPPGTETCKDHCDQKHADGSAYHDHPLRRTQNKNNGRILGPPGSAPEKNKGLESRDKCNW